MSTNNPNASGWAISGCSFSLGGEKYFHDFSALAEKWQGDRAHISFNKGSVTASTFDSTFFSVSPKEATLMDPQQRMLLECSWKALEGAGIIPDVFDGRIGFFGGGAENTYLRNILLPSGYGNQPDHTLAIRLGNSADFLATRVAYALGLTGPSLSVQAAECTLAASIHLACRSLASFECDLALAAGVSLQCHNAADKHGKDILERSEGVAVFVLRRMEDAIEDGDHILAEISGSAMGFAGADRRSPRFSAEVEDIVLRAYRDAEFNPEDLGFLELCSTNDTQEREADIAAITAAFREYAEKKSFCAIGSWAGEKDAAEPGRGIGALLHTLCAIQDGFLPLHSWAESNPGAILDENTPFYFYDQGTPWQRDGRRRRAAFHCMSRHGYCAHLLVQEHLPRRRQTRSERSIELFPISAKSRKSLTRYFPRMAIALNGLDPACFEDAAFTLQTRRVHFEYRSCVVAQNAEEAGSAFRALAENSAPGKVDPERIPSVFFLFSGQGMHYRGMAKSLYHKEPAFRQTIDYCIEYLLQHAHCDIRSYLLDSGGAPSTTGKDVLEPPSVIQPALFTIQYAMAKLWQHWGIQPCGVLGHSLGEITAACLAGVMTIDEALHVVARRGAIVEQLPTGSMAAVITPRETLLELLRFHRVEIAAENGPGMFTVTGKTDEIDAFAKEARKNSIGCLKLKTSHAFHSRTMLAAVNPLQEAFDSVNLRPPNIPLASSASGKWLGSEEARNSRFWAEQIHRPVLFEPALTKAIEKYPGIFLEMGPGESLTLIGKRTCSQTGFPLFYSCMSPQIKKNDVHKGVFQRLATIWEKGVPVEWQRMHGKRRCIHLPLPTYPFERKLHWPQPITVQPIFPQLKKERLRLSNWFSVPGWQKENIDSAIGLPSISRQILLFADEQGLGDAIARVMTGKGDTVTLVRRGKSFSTSNRHNVTIRPTVEQDYHDLLIHLHTLGVSPDLFTYCWSYLPLSFSGEKEGDTIKEKCFIQLVWLIRAVNAFRGNVARKFSIVVDELHQITGSEHLVPMKSLLLGAHNVLTQEFPECRSCIIDVPSTSHLNGSEKLIDNIVDAMKGDYAIAALRDGSRWTPAVFSCSMPFADSGRRLLRRNGVYIIIGGTGGIGLTVAKGLAREVGARIALVGRRSISKLLDDEERFYSSALGEAIEEMQSMGAEVGLFSADVADREEMQSVLDQVRAKWQEIHGVIHAAGIPGGSVMAHLTAEEVNRVIRPKVEGAFILDELTSHDNLDFLVLCSSLSSIIGGAAQSHYSAANAFLNAFAHDRCRRRKGICLSIAWDTWREVGMAANSDTHATMADHRSRQLEFGINPTEGWEVFLRVLGAGKSLVYVSTRSLEVRRKAVLKVETLSTGNGSSQTTPPVKEETPSGPDLLAAIVAIWQEVLGFSSLSPTDNFFDLGGNSLLGLTLINRLQNELKLEIPLSALQSISSPADMLKAMAADTPGIESTPEEDTSSSGLSETEAKQIMTVLGSSPVPLVSQDSFMKGYNRNGSRHPIFWCFNSPTTEPQVLAEILGKDQPIYALFSGVGVLEWKEETAEKLAQKLALEYVNDIVTIQPDGPYWLGGNCAGARVAWALAKMLQSRGQSIERLCLMEYFNEQLFDYAHPLLLLYGKQSDLKAYKKFRWLEQGWEKTFTVVPEVEWIPGRHGEFFRKENVGDLGKAIGRFYRKRNMRGLTEKLFRILGKFRD